MQSRCQHGFFNSIRLPIRLPWRAAALLVTIPVERCGHCDFQEQEILSTFEQLIQLVASHPTPAPTATLTSTPTADLIPTTANSSTTVEKPVQKQQPEKQGVFR